MDDIDEDDFMDDADEFALPKNAEIANDDEVPENDTKEVGGNGTVHNKRAPCWKHFKVITSDGHPKPRVACNWCVQSYACHSKNNGLLSVKCWMDTPVACCCQFLFFGVGSGNKKCY